MTSHFRDPVFPADRIHARGVLMPNGGHQLDLTLSQHVPAVRLSLDDMRRLEETIAVLRREAMIVDGATVELHHPKPIHIEVE
jgi:hypothetical protein